jgi:hypothetical protein
MHTICFKYKRKYFLRRIALSTAIMRRIMAQLLLFRYVTGRGQQCPVVQRQEVLNIVPSTLTRTSVSSLVSLIVHLM